MNAIRAQSPLDDFRAALVDAGMHPPDRIVPGKIHRFPGIDQERGDAGWCRIFEDLRTGVFGDFRTGEKHVWQARLWLSPAEWEAMRRQVKAEIARRRQQEREQHKRAAVRACTDWDSASDDAGEHPYLVRKGVRAHGVRVAGRMLLIPLRDTQGALWSLQRIDPEGEKRYLPGGRTGGLMHAIGRLRWSGIVLVAEGYATAATLHEITGRTCVAAMTAGNLAAVCKALVRCRPRVRLVVCADDDRGTEAKRGKNPGIEYATAAATSVGGVVAVPDFKGEPGTDFNDLAKVWGRLAVIQEIESATKAVMR